MLLLLFLSSLPLCCFNFEDAVHILLLLLLLLRQVDGTCGRVVPSPRLRLLLLLWLLRLRRSGLLLLWLRLLLLPLLLRLLLCSSMEGLERRGDRPKDQRLRAEVGGPSKPSRHHNRFCWRHCYRRHRCCFCRCCFWRLRLRGVRWTRRRRFCW